MNKDIQYIALGLKDLYDTNNPFDLCECLDIIVLYDDLGDELSGFFQRTPDGTEIIHLNNRLNEHERRYTCGHELGHAILQPDLANSFFIENPLLLHSKYEIEADSFAAELLLEDNLSEKYHGYTIEQVAAAEKVSARLVKLKIKK